MTIEITDELRQRFWEKVSVGQRKEDCWYWTASLYRKGYGKFFVNGREERAHRIAWIIASGERIPLGFDVHHTCGVKDCVSPRHLELMEHGEHTRHHLETWQ